MASTLHDYLIKATRKAASDLEEAYRRLPEDKRHWTPGGEARTAADIMAECALMNDVSDLLKTRVFPEWDYAAFTAAKEKFAQDESVMLSQLHEGLDKSFAAFADVPEGDLQAEIPMPWGTYTVAEVMAYPYWNMTYHLGQLTTYAMILGVEV